MNKIENYKINRIINPSKNSHQFTIEDLNLYFKSCGYPDEEFNIINGYGWHVYLTSNDYREYTRTLQSKEDRMNLKKQIIKLIKNNDKA